MKPKYSISNIIKYSSGEIISRIPLTLLEMSLVAILSPSLYGAWSLIQSLVSYGNFSHFGIASSLTRKEPGLISKNLFAQIKKYRSNAYASQIIIIIFISLILILWNKIFKNSFELIGGYPSIIFLLITIYLQQLLIVGYSSSINELKIKLVSFLRIFYSLIFLFLGLLAAIYHKSIYSLLISWSISLLVTFIILIRNVPSLRIKPEFDRHITKLLLFDGFPILFQGLQRFAIVNIDRLFLIKVSTLENLGYYSIGLLASNLVSLPGTIITKVTLPIILRRISSLGFYTDENKKVVKVSIMLIHKSCIFLGLILTVFLPIIIRNLFPAYLPSLDLCTILIIVGVEIGIAQSCIDFTLAVGKKKKILIITSLFIPIILISHSLFWINYKSITFLAISLFICITVYTSIIINICLNYFKINRAESKRINLIIISDILKYLILGLSYNFALNTSLDNKYYIILIIILISTSLIITEINSIIKVSKEYQKLNN